MTTLSLRECYGLEGASNFTPCICILQMLLENIEFWEHIGNVRFTLTNLKLLVVHSKKKAKAKRIILDSMKEHFITHILENKIDKEIVLGWIIEKYPCF
jgi:hypothetical protein